MGRKIILDPSDTVSQGYGRVNCSDDGLRILARLIARDIAAKRRDNVNGKTGKNEDAHKKLESCR